MTTFKDRIDQPIKRHPPADRGSVDDAVVKPVKGKRTPDTGRLAVLVGTVVDLDQLVRSMGLTAQRPHPLFTSRLFVRDQNDAEPISLVGPIVGAPYAVMLLETLVAWGVRHFFFLGWCGAVSPAVKIGDILLPTAALIDEGTSVHYCDSREAPTVSHPTPASVEMIRHMLAPENTRLHAGAVWTTDAIFRETPDKIRRFQAEGALAVDMEMSALFSAAHYRGVDIGGMLVVSDELSSLHWVPGFKTEAFASGRSLACQMIERLCQPLSIHTSPKESQS
ncbi:MAG: nucleoside phosphorylase [Desulfobacterales bacterium]|nr:nucleoside phosphorylase [Desulfobacterales bacterium]